MNSTDKNSKLTQEELAAWARTRVRMLVARLVLMAAQGRKIP